MHSCGVVFPSPSQHHSTASMRVFHLNQCFTSLVDDANRATKTQGLLRVGGRRWAVGGRRSDGNCSGDADADSVLSVRCLLLVFLCTLPACRRTSCQFPSLLSSPLLSLPPSVPSVCLSVTASSQSHHSNTQPFPPSVSSRPQTLPRATTATTTCCNPPQTRVFPLYAPATSTTTTATDHPPPALCRRPSLNQSSPVQ